MVHADAPMHALLLDGMHDIYKKKCTFRICLTKLWWGGTQKLVKEVTCFIISQNIPSIVENLASIAADSSLQCWTRVVEYICGCMYPFLLIPPFHFCCLVIIFIVFFFAIFKHASPTLSKEEKEKKKKKKIVKCMWFNRLYVPHYCLFP